MAKWPEEFGHIEALVLLNVVSGKTFIERHFGQHPERLVGWFDRHMGRTVQSQPATEPMVGSV